MGEPVLGYVAARQWIARVWLAWSGRLNVFWIGVRCRKRKLSLICGTHQARAEMAQSSANGQCKQNEEKQTRPNPPALAGISEAVS
jgi:hypothetical protein